MSRWSPPTLLGLPLGLLLACEPASPPPGGPGPDPKGRDRQLHAARGAPVHEEAWEGAWTLRVLSADPADPAAAALAASLGAALSPRSEFEGPGRGALTALWLPGGSDTRDTRERSQGGALLFVLGPGPRPWRDGAVAGLAFAGGGIVDSLASSARFLPENEALEPIFAAGAAAWEISHHYGLPLRGPPIADAGLLSVALGAPAPADAGPLTRAWAVRAGSQDAAAARDDADPVLRLAGLAQADPTAARALCADPEPMVRARALDLQVDPVLLQAALADPSSVVRLMAADRLAALTREKRLPPDDLRPGLRAAAALPDAYLRWKAANAFGHLPGSVGDLLPLLQDEDIDVRREAARALGRQQDPAAIPGLERALLDPNSFVRQWAARGLGQLRHPDALPALRRAAQDPTALVAQVAVEGLAALGERAQLKPYQPPRPGDTAALLAMAAGPDGTARKDALKLLAGSAEGTNAAIAALSDSDSEVRKQAVESLGWAAQAHAEVLHALPDPDPDVRVTALIALRRRPLPGSAAQVAPLLADADPEVRLRAAQALAALAHQEGAGGAAAAALRPVIGDGDERTRAAAIGVFPAELSPTEPSLLVQRAAAEAGGPPCAGGPFSALARAACPGEPVEDAVAAVGLIALEDDLLHLRASWTSPEDRPSSHRALRPPVLRPYGDPDRG